MERWARWWERRSVRLALALALALAGGGGWDFAQTRPDGRLHLIFPALDGDALLALTPNGRAVLIDGGADAVGLAELVGGYLPFWRRSIDGLVLTRADGERLPGALALARRYQIGQALVAPLDSGAQAAALREALADQAAPVAIGAAGMRLAIDGLEIEVLEPASGEAGMALRLRFGEWSGLLAPAPDDEQAARLLAEAGPADLLWWPWGRADDRRLSERLGAGVVVYGGLRMEHEEPRSMFQRGGAERLLLHERLHGTIDIATDGRQLWIAPELRPVEGTYAPQSRPRAVQRQQQLLRRAAQADHIRQRPQRWRPLHPV